MSGPRDPRVRVALALVALAFGLVLVLGAVNRLTPEPEGPRSSSYATSPAGLAAYAAVLERAGHPVRRARTSITDSPPRDGETLIVLEPDAMEPEESQAIGDWVYTGGRLVAGGSRDAPWLENVLGEEPPRWGGGEGRHVPLLPVVETAGVREVVSLEAGGWHDIGDTLPVIGPADAPLVVTVAVGDGTVTLLADPSPLQNRGLARADNAAFGLALAGGRDTPVAFLETVHGYGVARGFGGLPTNVKWTLLGLALTALVALWAAGRRFGPPEELDTPLPPPRVEYVDALASALVRTKPDKEDGS